MVKGMTHDNRLPDYSKRRGKINAGSHAAPSRSRRSDWPVALVVLSLGRRLAPTKTNEMRWNTV